MGEVQKLGEVLLSIGAVDAGGLNRALMLQRSTGGRLGTILLEQGIVSEETLARALARATGRNYAHWDRVLAAPREVLALLPPKIAIRAGAVPFEREGRVLRVAMRDPNDLAVEDELALVAGRKIEPWTIAEFRLAEALERFYGERRSARFRVLSERIERGIRPSVPISTTPPPPPPNLRGEPASVPALPVENDRPRDFRPSDVWRVTGSSQSDEIEIATWRPTPYPRPSYAPPAAPIDFLADDEIAVPPGVADPAPPLDPPVAPPPVGLEKGPDASTPVNPPPRVEPSPAPAVPGPGPRRPESVEQVRERIRSAETREDVADAVLDYLAPAFRIAALFIARKDDVIGWQARGEGVSRSGFKSVQIPFRDPSIFLNVRLSTTAYQGRLPDLPAHASLLEAFAHVPGECAVFPVSMKKRVVAFLFLELDGPALPRERTDEMKELASAVADGLAALILQQRARS